MPHPLVTQVRFTRSEFLRGVSGISDEDSRRRIMPMNCISWNIGHLAWQEQRYFLRYAQGVVPYPEIDRLFAYGAPPCTPPLEEALSAWKAITAGIDPWLESLPPEKLVENVVRDGKPTRYIYGSLILRMIYHYWYHNGENQAIRQMLGHGGLPEFVGDIDSEAPYRAE